MELGELAGWKLGEEVGGRGGDCGDEGGDDVLEALWDWEEGDLRLLA